MEGHRGSASKSIGVTRVLADLVALQLLAGAFLTVLVACILSDATGPNEVQVVIAILAAPCMLVSSALAVVYAGSGENARELLISLIALATLVGLFLLGFATWCNDTCQVP
jgi:hypothetical protein